MPLPFTISGVAHKKYKLRLIFRTTSFLLLVVGFSIFNYLSNLESSTNGDAFTNENRRLDVNDEDDDDGCADPADPPALVVVHVCVVLYMFLALAISCDEFFVPALEEMASERHLGLSPDVAGATLMAAGGSAPELFTSFIGTFTESDIGFGTIVGSAVFNVLFVIAMCAFLSKDILTLTWWPLFRDCTYYAFGLAVLSIFVGYTSEGEIELWEAIVLFVLYLGYIILMKYHERLYEWICVKFLAKPVSRDVDGSIHGVRSNRSLNGNESTIQFNRHATFRAGVLKLLHDPYSWLNTAGVGIVSKIAGDVGEVFRRIDANGDGYLGFDELRSIFQELDMSLSDDELLEVIKQVDEDGDGLINEAEFANWYIRSENRMRNKVQQLFKRFDADKNGTIDRHEVRSLLETLEPRVTDEDVDEALREMYLEGDTETVSYDEFEKWYSQSLFWENQKKDIEEELESVWENLKRPVGEGFFSHLRWIIVSPLVLVMALTVPDVRNPRYTKFCYISFILSILWIGVFSFFMVRATEVIGATLGIPSVVMGLTFLAAGTSVPDLLSSVIVAKMGEGDMAVSSSIGSNIFDILVGLPIPWIAFTAWPNDKNIVEIGSDGISLSIVILLGMLVSIITIIHFQGW
eukprot:CAMPEP_0116063502 /NCGR_PEP_ID=MMETSP0322-20121206/8465_1 /TAXON_ID=163516 /ORGANISM="Leptocylindrus danicus var. apora, Strain B651" /LENGTH=633 /DNA_ID=CAMNT_0003549157 /DNA_START=47 /DNA_END=1945 /DNA_ORIENTATION=+